MPDQDRKLLWGKAGNRCAICKKLLVNTEDGDTRGVIVAVESHIVGHSIDGPRGNDPMPLNERHKYENIILLCSEHSKTIDERTDVWTVEKLRSLKNEHEQTMREIAPELRTPHPILRLVLPVGYSGGPNGHFQTLTIKNLDKKTALDLDCWIEGFGYNLKLSTDTAGTYLESGQSKDFQFRLDGERMSTTEVPLLSFYARYSNLEGQRILYQSQLKQKLVPSGAFSIIELGSKNAYQKVRSEAKIDDMAMLGFLGGSHEALFTTGENQFKIRVSTTLSSCWGITTEESISYCLYELAKANLKVMSSLGVYQDKEYLTTTLPDDCSAGFEGFTKTLEHIEAGNY
jgi:hypothetical protein